MPRYKGMTDKQEAFCANYIVHYNAKEAAISAGYSERSANNIGYELLQKDHIQKRIKELSKDKRESVKISAEETLKEVHGMAMACITDVLNYEGEEMTIKAFQEMTPAARRAIAQITKNKDGSFVVKMHNKDGALDKLMKHLGLYDKDNSQKANVTLSGGAVFSLEKPKEDDN